MLGQKANPSPSSSPQQSPDFRGYSGQEMASQWSEVGGGERREARFELAAMDLAELG